MNKRLKELLKEKKQLDEGYESRNKNNSIVRTGINRGELEYQKELSRITTQIIDLRHGRRL